MKAITWVMGLLLLIILGKAALIWSGAYNIAADVPHWRLTERVMEMVRDRSIARRATGMAVPDLSDESLIRTGAGNYEAMCVACHLQPGAATTELSRGLYPAPPPLVKNQPVSPAKAFWVIKHGIKMSGMPAWGRSMEDGAIWGMVAFLQKLPGMSPAHYHELVTTSGGHSHANAPEELRDHDDETEHLDGQDAKIHLHADGSQHEHKN